METVKRKIDKLGRIVLPMDFRKSLELEGEAEVVLSITENTIIISGINNACKLCASTRRVSKHLRICAECILKIKNDNSNSLL